MTISGIPMLMIHTDLVPSGAVALSVGSLRGKTRLVVAMVGPRVNNSPSPDLKALCLPRGYKDDSNAGLTVQVECFRI